MRLHPLLLAPLCLAASALAARADSAPRTVLDYAKVLEAAAARLDALVTERQKGGDMAAAQRLALVASMARRSGEEFRGSEQAVMTDDVSRLPAPVREHLATAVAAANDAAPDNPSLVDDAQRAFNGLAASLPVYPPHPIFYGVLSRDVAKEALPADLVIYGYRVTDPALKVAPTVTIRNTDIPAVAVNDDRIEVALAADMKKALNFSPPPCGQRAGFGVRVVGAYAKPRGVWPISWNNQIESAADLFVLPTPVGYDVKVTTRVGVVTASTSTVPFAAKSELVVADCGETHKAEIDVALPAGYQSLTCTSAWTDSSGAAKVAGRCETDGLTLHVTGELSGGQKVCSPDKLCTCPSSAQGFLEASGSYQVQAPGETVKTERQPEPLSFPAGGLAERRLDAGEDGKLRHLTLGFSRRNCPTEVDSLDLNVPDDPLERADALSKTGAFRAAFQRGSLTVGAIDAFPTALDKAP